MSSTLRTRCGSRNGPFLTERAIVGSLLAAIALTAPADDEFVGPLVPAGGQSLRLLSPRRDRMGVSLPRFSLAAAVGMVHRVHCKSSNRRTNTQPAALARLADSDDLMVDLSQLSDGRAAPSQNLSHPPPLPTPLPIA